MENIAPVIAGISMIVITVLIIRYKLKKTELEMRGSDAELGPVVDELRDDLDDTRGRLADMQEHTRGQLAQMQERLDFAERLLTAGRASHEDRSGRPSFSRVEVANQPRTPLGRSGLSLRDRTATAPAVVGISNRSVTIRGCKWSWEVKGKARRDANHGNPLWLR